MTSVIERDPQPPRAPEASPPNGSGAGPTSGEAESASETPLARLRAVLGHRRRRIAIVLAILVGFAAFYLAVQIVVHEQRQQHMAADIDEPKFELADGDVAGVLQIPDLGINEMIIEGTGRAQLRSGPGRVADSARPGEPGDVVLLGHRTLYGAPFGALDQITPGTGIALKTRANLLRAYKATSTVTLGADEPLPVQDDSQLRDGAERLLLVTSASGWYPRARIVVVADAVEGQAPAPGAQEREAGAPVPTGGTLQLSRLSPGVGLLLVLLEVVGAVGLYAIASDMSRRVSRLALAVVVVPVGVLLFTLTAFTVDLVFPATY